MLLQEWPHHDDEGLTDEPHEQAPARRAEATTNDDGNRAKDESALIEGNIEVEEVTIKKAASELRAISGPPDQVSKVCPQDEPPGISLESSSLVDEVAEELWHL